MNPIARQKDLSEYNSPAMWIHYLEEELSKIPSFPEYWQDWIREPDRLLLKNDFNSENQNSSIVDLITARDHDLQGLILKYQETLNQIQTTKKLPFRILRINWDHLLCYGANNYFNFETLDHQIGVIKGNNSDGKSSFMEILALCLYGEEFPSRCDKSNSSVIICRKKPAGT